MIRITTCNKKFIVAKETAKEEIEFSVFSEKKYQYASDIIKELAGDENYYLSGEARNVIYAISDANRYIFS